MHLSDKCISMGSHAIGTDTPNEEEFITSHVEDGFSTNRDLLFISSSYFKQIFQKNYTQT